MAKSDWRLESYDQFKRGKETATFTRCMFCEKPFTPSTVKTAEGWRETQISGICESCFDTILVDDDELDELGE
jgi:hypothetical protein